MNYKVHDKNRKKIPILIILLIITTFTLSNIVYIASAEAIPTVSTRGHFDKSSGSSTSSQFYKPLSDEVLDNICRESEAVLYVHGVWTNEKGHSLKAVENTQEIFDRLKMSLKDAGYDHTLIGFSWDSDTQIDEDGIGWNIAKLIAKENGPKLAKFIIDLKNYCIEHHDIDIEIRLVAHSLGSRVILSALDSLDNDSMWKSSHFKISTVNLLGGAVDNYEVLKSNVATPINDDIKEYYGNPIQNQVIKFYNMYNPEDDVLEIKIYAEWDEPLYYPWYEGDDIAIGQNPLFEGSLFMPSNYKNINVQDQIIYDRDADRDGDECDLPNLYYKRYWGIDICTIFGDGDNHLGYIGFRNSNNSIMDNGAIDEVIKTWTPS